MTSSGVPCSAISWSDALRQVLLHDLGRRLMNVGRHELGRVEDRSGPVWGPCHPRGLRAGDKCRPGHNQFFGSLQEFLHGKFPLSGL